jgi:beta-lactam-binding protein with PASTA domain
VAALFLWIGGIGLPSRGAATLEGSAGGPHGVDALASWGTVREALPSGRAASGFQIGTSPNRAGVKNRLPGASFEFAAGAGLAAAASGQVLVAFHASTDDAIVASYLLEVFANGSDPNTAAPIASSDLGKPVMDASGVITVDQSTFFNALTPGTYLVTVSSVGPGGSSRSTAVTDTQPAPPVLPGLPTVTLSPASSTIAAGQSATLIWSTSNATVVSFDQGIGAVGPWGIGSVYPAATTTYTLTATNAIGSATATATVTVGADTAPPVISGVTSSNLTTTGATISFTTNEPSYHQVEYGTTTSYGTVTALDSTPRTSHSQALTGLAAGTFYHYRVRASDPAGNTATSGDSTFATTGVAPPPVSVPNVVGLTQTAAASAITSAGLTVGTVTTASSATVAAGHVISEFPAAGTSVAVGSPVNVVVSSGPAPVNVPNLVGLTQAAAASAITSAGLTVGAVTTASSATVAAGLVIGEFPAAGTSVPVGSAVNLVVSSGATPVNVPNVVGLIQAAAMSAITAEGLTVGKVTTAASSTVAVGSVISQSPGSGTSVAAGSAVDLVIAVSGNPMNTTPTITSIGPQTTKPGTPTGAIAFTIDDVESAAASLTVAATSSNPTLVSDTQITFGGSGANRTVTLAPAAGQSGTATIVVTVSDGTSAASTTFVLTVTRTVWPHLLDLNGDRLGDAFLYNKATGDRRFELANVTTGFTEIQNAWDPGWQVYPANLNADAYTDFFLYDPARGYWIQALNNGGDGTFTYALGNWDSSWTVVPADLDGDGLTDMFVYNFSTGVWVKCFVDGGGGFKGYAAGSWDPGWTFYTADLNGDGRDDFFLYNRMNGLWVEAFSQAGLGTFDYPASGQWDPGWQVIPADLNGDGRTDLFLLNAAGVHSSALSRATGGFDYVGGPQWAPGWSVAPGDLNGDGTADLFLYNSATGMWIEAFSDSIGGFSFSTVGHWDPGWTAAMTDVNGDGRGDIVLSRADGMWVQATYTGVATFTYTAGNWGPGWMAYARRP